MSDDLVTVDLILDTLRKWIEEKQPIAPWLWIDACSKINLLKGDENAKLYDLQQKVALCKVVMIESGDSVAKAKARTEASDVYKAYKLQEAKMEMIDEQIKISKLQARMSLDELRGN